MKKWTEENIIKELKIIIDKINHFPYPRELKQMKRSDILGAIYRNGGSYKFKNLLKSDSYRNPNNYWSEERVLLELKIIIDKLGYFPIQSELSKFKNSISFGINKNGGINKFRLLLGYNPIIHLDNYWNENNIKEELQKITLRIGHFPLYRELDIRGLNYAVDKFGGLNKFRELLGYKLIRVKRNYWSIENTKEEIKKIIIEIGHFPTIEELILLKRNDLIHALGKNGGVNKLKEILGYTISIDNEYISKSMSYNVRRGKKTENIVKEILKNYCNFHNLSLPSYNVKLCEGNIIEFVCNTNKTIGIDVTNTKSNKRNINKKWTKKDYHKHLDELWIVVFSNTFTQEDYIKWNKESPENVKIMSIYTFLKELDYSISEDTKNKIDKYNQCTFHTKEELKENI